MKTLWILLALTPTYCGFGTKAEVKIYQTEAECQKQADRVNEELGRAHCNTLEQVLRESK